METPNFGCCCHSLALAVEDALLKQPSVVSLLAIGRKIVGHFNHSTKAFKALNAYQTQHQVKETVLFQDNNTRWNSSYLMLQRLLENESALITYDAKTPTNVRFFTGSEWSLVSKVCSLLKVFHASTVQMSKQKASIASCGKDRKQ